MQTIAKHFWESGSQYIDINTVRNDGLSYWPRFGAIPHQGVPNYRSYLPPFMHDEFMNSDGQILQQAAEIAKSDMEAAWFYITDPQTGASRDLIQRLNSGSQDFSMHMDLTNPVTRQRLALDQI